ncbi:MAG: c-type cytochrome [Pseudomonadota bacterium]
MRFLLCAALMALPSLAMADDIPSERGLKGFVTVDRLPVPENAALAAGREIWAGTCENCHGGNKATGAPKITSTRAWAPRIDQGMDVMTTHAIDGFLGKTFAQMPARGGNLDLTDEQVAAAVAFMVWVSGGEELAEDFATTLSLTQ